MENSSSVPIVPKHWALIQGQNDKGPTMTPIYMSEEIYRQQILDHYKHPRNYGTLNKYTHSAGLKNISCGDAVQFQVVVAQDMIKEIAFTGQGCAISMAASSMLSEYAKNKSLAAIQAMNKNGIEKLIQIHVSGAREKCAMLGLETLKQLKEIDSK